jgi:hypothetical protein
MNKQTDELALVGYQAKKCRDDAISSAQKMLRDSFNNDGKVEITPPMKDNNSKFYKCGCSTHLLEIDTSFREEENEVYFSIWELGRNTDKMTIRERIRWCWRILTTGSPWSDSVILDEEQVKEIVEQLKK